MATQAPAAFDLDVRRIEAREVIDALLCTATVRYLGTSPVPGWSFPSSPEPLCREPHVPGTGSDLPVTILAVCESSQALACLTTGPRT
jgi:hypothetical protein